MWQFLQLFTHKHKYVGKCAFVSQAWNELCHLQSVVKLDLQKLY